jgi:Tol biopolymer transport system component
VTRTVLLSASVILAVVLLAAAAALLAVPKEAEATFPGQNGKIAYVSNGPGDHEIFTIDPDGGADTNITNNDLPHEDTPSYSPDGTRIAYSKENLAEDLPRYDREIYTIRVTGGGKTQVTNSQYLVGDPSWGSRP